MAYKTYPEEGGSGDIGLDIGVAQGQAVVEKFHKLNVVGSEAEFGLAICGHPNRAVLD